MRFSEKSFADADSKIAERVTAYPEVSQNWVTTGMVRRLDPWRV